MLSFSLLCKQLFIQLINRKARVESLLSRNRGTKMFEREQYLTLKQQQHIQLSNTYDFEVSSHPLQCPK